MKNFAKINVFFLAGIFLLIGFCSICSAASSKAAFKESGLKVTPVVKDGKVTEIKVAVGAANGGPNINSLKVDQPEFTALMATVSLTAKSGIYKIELLDNGKPTLALTAKDGLTVKGGGRVSVDYDGAIQYFVTAKKAKNVTLNFSFTPIAAVIATSKTKTNKEGSSASIADKTLPSGAKPLTDEKPLSPSDDLKLILSCEAGKNCRLQVQNMSRLKSYRNISFKLNYKMMTAGETIEKSKNGIIEDALSPNKNDEWPIGLVFGEPPKDLEISLVNAEGIDPADTKAPGIDQQKSGLRPLISLDKQKKSDPVATPAAPVTVPTTPTPETPLPSLALPTSNHLKSLRFFESGYDAIPYEKRIYVNEFSAAKVSFINWELVLQHPAPGKKIEYDVEAVWSGADGSTIVRQTQHALMEADWADNYTSHSWGSPDAGKVWQPGFYTVDLSIGGNKIASGSFKVY